MTDRPTTEAGRALLARKSREWVLDAILAIEAEARQPDSEALRLLRNLLAWWDDSEGDVWPPVAEARAYLAALPPSAPPALDVERLVQAIRSCTDIEVRGPDEHIGPHIRDEYARLASQPGEET